MGQMTLTEFVDYFDFDYWLYDNGKELLIGLIDNQGANLGDIEQDRFLNNKEGVLDIINRLETYYEDYIFNDLEIELEENGIDTSNMSWKDMYNATKKLDCGSGIMAYIFGDKEVILDSQDKEIVKEY